MEALTGLSVSFVDQGIKTALGTFCQKHFLVRLKIAAVQEGQHNDLRTCYIMKSLAEVFTTCQGNFNIEYVSNIGNIFSRKATLVN